MSELRDKLTELRAQFAQAAGGGESPQFNEQLELLAKKVDAQASQLERLRQDVADAEHQRDAANLARMRVFGQLNTLHKTLVAATPQFEGGDEADPQHSALRRVEWLVTRGGVDPRAAAAAREAEMDAPMPSRAVLEAVTRGDRRFTKPQLEFSVSEAIVLTGWDMTPVEILAKGEPWLAGLILSNHAAPPD